MSRSQQARERSPEPDGNRREARLRLRRTVQQDLLPRLLFTHRAGPVAPEVAQRIAETLGPEAVEKFVDIVRHGSESGVDEHIEELRHLGVSAESIYLDLLAPSARRLGELWETDDCDFMEVTLALGRMQRVLRKLNRIFLREAPEGEETGSILLSCLPGEGHSLGLIIVAEFFVRDGWAVQMGSPFRDQDELGLLEEERYDLAGISLSCDSDVPQLVRHIQDIREASRNPDIEVMVGGRVFMERPELVERVGADAGAWDAREAVRTARRLVGRGRDQNSEAMARAQGPDG